MEEYIPDDERPSINTRLLTVIAKAMKKRRDDRFKDAPDMLSHITEVLTPMISSLSIPDFRTVWHILTPVLMN